MRFKGVNRSSRGVVKMNSRLVGGWWWLEVVGCG